MKPSRCGHRGLNSPRAKCGCFMGSTLGILFTWTTYGTWLRGDQRGWVEDGITYPADPELRAADRDRMSHPPFCFADEQLLQVGTMIGKSLVERKAVSIVALTVQTWHVHLLIEATNHPVEAIVKCGKDAVRWGLRPGRPIWTDGYDKRFCYDEASLDTRQAYVEKHNLERGWPAKPWSFVI